MSVLLVERSEGVVTATMNRPEVRNALDAELFEELRALFVEVGERADDRVLVLTGAGGAFSSGGDLAPAQPSGDDVVTVMRRYGLTALALHECPKPVIAAVDGAAVGAGVSLVLGCDLVVTSERARFSLLFVHHGLALDCGASWLLPRRVGPQKAAEMALLGEWVDAAEALRIGLVNRVVPTGDLQTAARGWALELAARTPLAVARIKRSLRRADESTLVDALEREALDQAECSASPEFREALRARRR
jgi:2-(1,2-epoxy-1,2-dihydrophenyl)acetyl-CoA isomerase